MKKYLVTDTTDEQLTLDEVKAHLRLSTSDEDSYLETLITTARKLAETGTSNYYGTQTIRLVFSREDEMGKTMELEHPFIAVTSVKTFLDGVEAEITDYSLRDEKLILSSLQDYDTLEIIQTAGKDAPAPVKSAMLLIVGHLYENREATTDLELKALPMGVRTLLGADKVVL